ncbi:propionyl-CoA carboxylase regulator [Lachnospiraceae bacterium]|nr:propionyl-CoA carboxylase regulator [Lachnospiraceae bacterium]
MTQGERVREIRKSLGLTLEKFGEKLGVGKTAISKIEHEQCSLTDANIKLICREFGVDYIWLTTGEGEMLVDSDDDFIEKIDRIMAGENDARKNMIKTLVNASDDDIQVLCRLIDSYNSLGGDDE